MSSNSLDKGEVAKYLLGEMSDSQQARFEESFFHNSELSEILSDAENDLTDQYVRGELSAHERELFEGRFLVSERRREKVELARVLLDLQTRDEASPQTVRADRSWWKSIAAAIRIPGGAPSYALAAVALLLLVGGLWLFSEVRQLRQEVAQLGAERDAQTKQNNQLLGQLTEQDKQRQDMAAQIDQLEQRLAEHDKESPTTDRGPGNLPALLVFSLFPSSRGESGSRELAVPPDSRAIRLKVNIRPGDDYPSYQVTLQTTSGREIRRWNDVKAASVSTAHAVFVDLPSSLLEKGSYELALSGSSHGRVVPLAYYYFSVSKN
jgi:hypothetical protein